jgi:hypothetical protein
MEMKRVWSLYEVQANDLVYIRTNPVTNSTKQFIIEIEIESDYWPYFKASYIAALGTGKDRKMFMKTMDFYPELVCNYKWEFYIIDYKDLVLYTHWSYKSKRFWELLEKVYG